MSLVHIMESVKFLHLENGFDSSCLAITNDYVPSTLRLSQHDFTLAHVHKHTLSTLLGIHLKNSTKQSVLCFSTSTFTQTHLLGMWAHFRALWRVDSKRKHLRNFGSDNDKTNNDNLQHRKRTVFDNNNVKGWIFFFLCFFCVDCSFRFAFFTLFAI